MTFTEYQNAAIAVGFTGAVWIPAGWLHCSSEIRKLCSPEKCELYGKSWVCPPGSGDLKECESLLHSYSAAFLLQTYQRDIDPQDPAQTARVKNGHNSRLAMLLKQIDQQYPDAYILTNGGCSICSKCTYPNQPCRNPQKLRGSLSAFGINVSEICKKAGLPFAFNENAAYFVTCVLVREPSAASNETEAHKCFSNISCKYFPCHSWDRKEPFNCMFCYCPLYLLGPHCGGSFRYTEKGIKDCSNCLLPHTLPGRDHILQKISTKAAEWQEATPVGKDEIQSVVRQGQFNESAPQ